MTLMNWDRNGTYYEYCKRADHVPLVFVHGVGLDSKSWRYLLKGFSEHTILTYDLLGHGRTKRNLESQSFEPFKDQLESLLKHLDIPEVILVGFSLGGLVAAHYASTYATTVSALVLISTVYQRTSEERQAIFSRVQQVRDGDLAGIRTAALERWFTKKYLDSNPHVREEITLGLESNHLKGFLPCYELLANADDYYLAYDNITMPTLILTGDADQGSTPMMARGMERVILSGNASIIRNAKHLCIIENHKEVSARIRQFLCRIL